MASHLIPLGKRLRSGYHKLTYRSHRVDDLCTFLKDHLNTPVELWSRSEQASVQDWNEWLQCWNQMCLTNTESNLIPSTADMNRAMKIISAVFFCNRLDTVPFQWAHMHGMYGCTSYHTGAPIISLIPQDNHIARGDIDIQSSKVGTLLHECVHAFVYLYSCNRSQTCLDKCCEQDRNYKLGDTGHGSGFIRIASHVEALQRQLTNFGVNLNIEGAMSHEFRVSTEFTGVRPEDLPDCHPSSHALLRAFWIKSVKMRNQVAEKSGLKQLAKTMASMSLDRDANGAVAIANEPTKAVDSRAEFIVNVVTILILVIMVFVAPRP